MNDLLSKDDRNVTDADVLIDDALQAIRTHLGMPVAYLSRFESDTATFRNVSAPGLEALIKPGDQMALSEVYCPRILSGELPNLIPDTGDEPICVGLPITKAVPIGSHVSLPVVLDDGEVYGMFCCLSPTPNPTLNERDIAVMTNFASLVTRQVQREEDARRLTAGDRKWITSIIEDREFKAVFQPLVRMSDGHVVGVEALSRFDTTNGFGPEVIFKTADDIGMGLDLELATLALQIEEARALPDGIYLSLNASAELICDPRFFDALPTDRLGNLAIEMTEHSEAEDEDALRMQIDRLRDSGAKFAIDDVGAGYSGLQRIAKLHPDILKIDRSIVTGIQDNIAQRAVVAALVHFAKETDAIVLVEGIETPQEADTLTSLGVQLAQGWFFGRPAPLCEVFPAAQTSAAKTA